jgi:carbon storage regulator
LDESSVFSTNQFKEECAMLVLSRKVGQELVIGDNIRIIISRVAGNRVSLGIQAPDNVHIMRSELKKIRDEFASDGSVQSFEVEVST